MCKQTIKDFLSRDFGHWTGLKAGCRKAEVESSFVFNPGEGVAYYGQQTVRYLFRSLSHEGFTRGVFFYFHDDVLGFVDTEYWSFDPQECDDLKLQLGSPHGRLDFYWKDEKIEKGEWVYADKGITLGVIPATGVIARVLVYPGCTLDEYKEKYYKTRLTREFR